MILSQPAYIIQAMAIVPDPDMHQSSCSFGTSVAHAHLPEYPIEYNTLLATRNLSNLLKLQHCMPNSNLKLKYLCNYVMVACKQHGTSSVTDHIKWHYHLH